jgi:hypothetical protein
MYLVWKPHHSFVYALYMEIFLELTDAMEVQIKITDWCRNTGGTY